MFKEVTYVHIFTGDGIIRHRYVHTDILIRGRRKRSARLEMFIYLLKKPYATFGFSFFIFQS